MWPFSSNETIKESGLPINSGDLISLRGQILEKHGGDPFYATVNGIETVDPDMKLHNGDEITITSSSENVIVSLSALKNGFRDRADGDNKSF